MNKERIAKKLIKLAEEMLKEAEEEEVRTKPIEDGWMHYYVTPEGQEYELYEYWIYEEIEDTGVIEPFLRVEMVVEGTLDFSEVYSKDELDRIKDDLKDRYESIWTDVFQYYVRRIPTT